MKDPWMGRRNAQIESGIRFLEETFGAKIHGMSDDDIQRSLREHWAK
jgi:hypothetical protein